MVFLVIVCNAFCLASPFRYFFSQLLSFDSVNIEYLLRFSFLYLQWPYHRDNKDDKLDDGERAFHDAARPSWGPDETLVLTRPNYKRQLRRSLRENPDILNLGKPIHQTSAQDVRLAKFSTQVCPQQHIGMTMNEN